MDLKGFGLSDDDLRQLGYDVEGRPRGPSTEPWPDRGAPTGQAPPREPKRWAPATRTWLATLLVLAAVGWSASSGRRLPSPVPVAAPDTAFSSGRAMAQLVDVARRARPTGSPENERVRSYLLGRLRSLGLEPELQTVTSFERDSAFVRAATVRNVVARVPGSGTTGALVLTAHYDGAPLSPAAGDDGIGVATVLETVRALLAGPPLRNDVIVLLTDGDELGLLGARAFAERHAWMSEVSAVLSVEARGASGPAVLFEAGSGNGRVVEAFAAAESRPAASSLARSQRLRALESAEHDPLLHEGVAAFSLSVLGDAALQHQSRDTRERVSERTVQHAGRQLLAVTRALGGTDLRSELAAPDRVYVSLPFAGLAHYPRIWVLPTTLALLAFWALVGLVLRGRRATRVGVGIAIVAGAAGVGASAVAARALRELTAGLHPEYGSLSTAFYEDGPYVLAAVALALACCCVVYAVARKWSRTDELVFGGLLLPLLYSGWLTFREPFAAPALQLPLVLALLGGGLVVALGPNRARSVWTWVVLVLLAAAQLVFVVPGVELLAAVWTFESATRLGALAGLAVVMQWPLMDRLLMPKAWWTPLAAVAVAGAFVVPTLPALRGADEHPVPTTLVYLADEPLIAAPAGARGPGVAVDASRIRSMAGKWLTVPGPGEEWARSWAGDPATGSTDAGVLMMGVDSLYEVAGTAPVSELAPPRVTVTANAVEGARRRVDLAVEPGLAGEMTGIHVPEGSPGALTGVGGAEWAVGGAPVRSVVHWGAPDTPALRVSLEVETSVSEVTLVILEHHLRPQEVVGTYFFQRADSLVANAALGSDRAIQRTRLSVPLADPAIAR